MKWKGVVPLSMHRSSQLLVQWFFSENEMEPVLCSLCFSLALSVASATAQGTPLVSSVSIEKVVLKEVTESKGEVTLAAVVHYNYTDKAVVKQVGEQLDVTGCITIDWETLKKVRTSAFCFS